LETRQDLELLINAFVTAQGLILWSSPSKIIGGIRPSVPSGIYAYDSNHLTLKLHADNFMLRFHVPFWLSNILVYLFYICPSWQKYKK